MKDLSDIAISAVAAAVQDLMEQEQKEAPFELGAPWTYHANPEELERLAKLHSRIQRKQRALSALIGERKTIMDRCIRRQRRTKGKN
jgi:hypothetical protein